jgi:hypothetical protein
MVNPVASSAKEVREASIGAEQLGGGNGDRRSDVIEEMTPVAAMVRLPIREQIDRALQCDDLEVMIAALVAVSWRRSATEAESLKTYVFQQLLSRTSDPLERRRLWTWTRLSAARPETEAREMACALLDAFWKDHRKDVERITLNLARDEDTEVRQYAAGTMARIVRANFRCRFRYLQKWSRHTDPSVRRQVIIATVGVADPEHPERAKQLLDLLEPHLTDRDPYVRRNLGPFALGQGLLRVYPEETLERFQRWLPSEDEVVRWNLAMALAAGVALSQWETALEVLRVLAADQRRFVWGAASAALGNMVRHCAEVRPILRHWMRDPQLRVAVTFALRNTRR